MRLLNGILISTLISFNAYAGLLYDGETVPFSASASWDQNGSKMVQTSLSPHTVPKHLRATINNVNWWGGVAYVPKNWQTLDFSKEDTISFWIKSNIATNIDFMLFDSNKKQGSKHTISVSTKYMQITLPLSKLKEGVDLTKVVAFVFATSQGKSVKYVVDIDDIATAPICYPAPNPEPTPPPPTPPPTPTPEPTPIGDQWLMGYYVGYQQSLYPPEKIDFTSITHLMVGRVIPKADGSLLTHLDIDTTSGPVLAKKLSGLAHAANRKAILMLGGDGEHAGWVGAAGSTNRATFISNLIKLVDDWKYDGLDLDWEPIEATDKPLLLALAKELKAARPNLILTLPVGWANANFSVDSWYKEIAPYIDRINVMSYYMAGNWDGWLSWHSSALKGHGGRHPSSLEVSANGYRAIGVPASKIGLGIGFFGVCWKGVTAPKMEIGGASIVASDNTMSYTNIMSKYYQQTAYKWDDAASVPYLSCSSGCGPLACNFLSMEDERSAKLKGEYVKANGLGGIIVWTVGQGYIPVSNTNPLLTALKEGML